MYFAVKTPSARKLLNFVMDNLGLKLDILPWKRSVWPHGQRERAILSLFDILLDVLIVFTVHSFLFLWMVFSLPFMERKKPIKKNHIKEFGGRDAPEASQGQTRDVPGTPGTFGPDYV